MNVRPSRMAMASAPSSAGCRSLVLARRRRPGLRVRVERRRAAFGRCGLVAGASVCAHPLSLEGLAPFASAGAYSSAGVPGAVPAALSSPTGPTHSRRGGPVATAERGEQLLRQKADKTKAKAEAGTGWYAVLARVGLVAKGVSYGLVGVLAIAVALGQGGKATSDGCGSLRSAGPSPTRRRRRSTAGTERNRHRWPPAGRGTAPSPGGTCASSPRSVAPADAAGSTARASAAPRVAATTRAFTTPPARGRPSRPPGRYTRSTLELRNSVRTDRPCCSYSTPSAHG